MSDFLGSPPARPRPQPDQAGTLEMLATLFLVAFVVAMLYVGREIFIPIAIAILVSFVLSPPILLLRRWGLGRVISVLTVVFAALVIAFSVSAVLTRQVSELAVDLPLYQATINAKLDDLRDAAADNALFAKVSAALKKLGEINPHRLAPSSAPAPLDQPKNQLTKGQESERPIPVEVHQPEPGPFAIVQTIAGTALSPLETTFIVVVFVIFILLQREDLRNRFIRLAGSSDLQRTTLAMNDAAGRLSRFFLVQTLVNASFGVIIAVGLYFIGLPSPILWGIVAFLLRFVPYIGPFIAAGFPVALAAAIDPGWGIALETLALFLIVEPIIGQGSRALALWPQYGDLADRRRDLGDILDVVVGHRRSCVVDPAHGLSCRARASRGAAGFSRCHLRRRAASDSGRKLLSTHARRGRLGSRRPSRTILENQLAHRLLRRGGAPGFADGAGGPSPRRAR